MILNSKFDVLRGWPKEGAIDETFPVYSPAGVPVALPQGTVIYVRTDGTVDKADTPDRATVEGVATWVVVEGNNDYSGTFLQKVVAIRANAKIRIEAANYEAGSYAVGDKLTFQTGKFSEATTGMQIIAEVMAIDSVNATMDIYYTGGDTAAK